MPPASVWIWAALDPILIAVALTLGWRADQKGKIFIAAIAAFAVALLTDWFLTSLGLPSFAPVSRGQPTLFPVRAVAALFWAALAYGTRQVARR